MKLTKLLERLDYKVVAGSDNIEITELVNDSRKVVPGSVFVCISGAVSDGHQYVKDVAERGAAAVIVEKDVEVPEGLTVIKVENTRYALALMSAAYFGYPAEKLKTIGITGTKGKTTTTYMVKPILEEGSGLKCGEDFYLGFSPERVDPGNLIYKTKNTPKVVGAIGKDATEVIAAMYRAVLEGDVYEVSSPAVAEMEKILENTYRNINIGLVNELTMLCRKMGISMWEVVDAAKTKPYGFQAFYPGPGLGGHCIPLDPYYLSWKAREYGFHTSMIESSMMINDQMPEYCVERAGKILNESEKSLKNAKVLILGVAYKNDIDDYRESPALRVIEVLEREGAKVSFYDPWVSEYRYKGKTVAGEKELTAELLESADLVMVTAAHTNVDYDFVQQHAKAVFDTKNAMKAVKSRANIEVL